MFLQCKVFNLTPNFQARGLIVVGLSTTDYSIYSQLTSKAGGQHLNHNLRGRAMPWWQELLLISSNTIIINNNSQI